MLCSETTIPEEILKLDNVNIDHGDDDLAKCGWDFTDQESGLGNKQNTGRCFEVHFMDILTYRLDFISHQWIAV